MMRIVKGCRLMCGWMHDEGVVRRAYDLRGSLDWMVKGWILRRYKTTDIKEMGNMMLGYYVCGAVKGLRWNKGTPRIRSADNLGFHESTVH
jgi:hypothetical protein